MSRASRQRPRDPSPRSAPGERASARDSASSAPRTIDKNADEGDDSDSGVEAAEVAARATASPLASSLARYRRLVGWLVLLLPFWWFNANGGHLNGGDTRALVDLSWWIGQGHAPRLDGHPAYLRRDAESLGYWAVERDGRLAVVWPTGVVAFAAPAFAALNALGVPVSAAKAPLVAKVVASALVASTIWMAWLLLVRTRGDREALTAASTLALASPWATNLAQALWIQTGALWCQAASCALLLPWLAGGANGEPSPGAGDDGTPGATSPRALDLRAAAAGFCAGWAAVCRPQFALWTLAFAALAFALAGKKRGALALAGTGVALIAGAALATVASGSPLGLYGAKNAAEAPFDPNPLAWLGRVAGLLISPGRGLFLWCPWTLAIVAGVVMTLRDRRQIPGQPRTAIRVDPCSSFVSPPLPLAWHLAHAAFVGASIAALAAYPAWSGGWSVGPRLQADWLFSGVLLAAPAWSWLTRNRARIVLLAIAILPAAWLHARAMSMTGDLFEAKNPDHPTRLWDLRLGALHWIASEGRIERALRGEERAPIVALGDGAWKLDPSAADAPRWFESGVAAAPGGQRLATTARDANLLFEFDGANVGDLVVALELADSADVEPGLMRDVELLANGASLARVEFATGSGGRPLVATVPASKIRADAPLRLTLRERRPPPGVFFRETALEFTIRLARADSEIGRRLLDAAAQFERRAEAR